MERWTGLADTTNAAGHRRLGLSDAEIEAVATRVADLLKEQQPNAELVDAAAIRAPVRRKPRFRLPARRRARRCATRRWSQGSASIRSDEGGPSPSKATREGHPRESAAGSAADNSAQIVPSPDSSAMRVVAAQDRVLRLWNISGSRRRANANREPDQKETWLLMADSDPMECGIAAAPPSTSIRRRPCIALGGDC
jgi:hypothetical protein